MNILFDERWHTGVYCAMLRQFGFVDHKMKKNSKLLNIDFYKKNYQFIDESELTVDYYKSSVFDPKQIIKVSDQTPLVKLFKNIINILFKDGVLGIESKNKSDTIKIEQFLKLKTRYNKKLSEVNASYPIFIFNSSSGIFYTTSKKSQFIKFELFNELFNNFQKCNDVIDKLFDIESSNISEECVEHQLQIDVNKLRKRKKLIKKAIIKEYKSININQLKLKK